MNKDINYNFFYWGPFLYKTVLSKKELEKIKKLCSKKHKDYRENLAGLIKNEHKIDTKKFFPLIYPYLESYKKAINNQYGIDLENNIKLMSSWVNYMTTGESNPIHRHYGDFSFVIYIKIPKKIKKQISRSTPGSINFLYTLEDQKYTINKHVFIPKEGDFFIFPASLNHYVNSFESDEERISVSGNITLTDE